MVVTAIGESRYRRESWYIVFMCDVAIVRLNPLAHQLLRQTTVEAYDTTRSPPFSI